MSERLKFRAWHPALQRMFYGVIVHPSSWTNDSTHYGGDHSTLMQFTGLLDSQGREIYEGDILELNDPEDYERGEIVFKGGAFVYLCEDGSSDYLGDCNTRAMTIIGNRFENPALIAP